MKKIFPLLLFCLACVFAWGNENPPNLVEVDSFCTVNIALDSSNTGDVILVAYPTGEAPFSYQWSNGETSSSIIVTTWGINYCVTVTDATGCEAVDCIFNQNSCSIDIFENPTGGLSATMTGTPPFSISWNTGESSQPIFPPSPGNYCVTLTDVTGCTSVDCFYWGNSPDSCLVNIAINQDSNGLFILTALTSGTAPFAYQWNYQNATTQSISVINNGQYCVTVTDANGAACHNCVYINNCSVTIIQEDSAGMTGLFAIPNMNAATFLWSNGSTDDVIFPASSGTYCVTVTGGGCVTSTCYYYLEPFNYAISGYVILEDSLLAPPYDGIAELFSFDAATSTWSLVASQTLANNPAQWAATFDFGTLPAGDYIVKTTLDPASPYAADYLPTYHYASTLWDEANIITLPNINSSLLIIMQDGQNLTGGSGNISGTVTEGDGLTANDEGDRGGAPRPNTSVVLFDNLEQPITHHATDDLGRYSFGNLPFGTYKVVVDVVGKDLTEKWVTLTASNSNIADLNFEVTETGVVLLSSIKELLVEEELTAFPNPTTGQLKLMFEAKVNFDALIKLSRLDGTTIHIENQQVAIGQQAIDFDMSNIPDGLYLLQLTTAKGVATVKVVKQ